MKKISVLCLTLLSLSFLFFVSCQKELSEENGNTNVTATGSLKDSTGACYSSTVSGTFYNGVTPGSDTCYVSVQVNVTSSGSYNISTDLQNGFKFADSGFFNTTGLQTILLKPIGTPILNIPTNFTYTFDTTACGFTVDVQDSTGTGLGGDGGGGGGGGIDPDSVANNSWKFTDSTISTTYTGIMPAGSTIFSTLLANTLLISGTSNNSDSVMLITLILPNPVIETGTYTTGGLNSFSFSSVSSGTTFYKADATTTEAINVEITSYDAATKILKGKFSGQAVDSLGNTVDIRHGAFNSVVN